jgi:hypothetical protein
MKGHSPGLLRSPAPSVRGPRLFPSAFSGHLNLFIIAYFPTKSNPSSKLQKAVAKIAGFLAESEKVSVRAQLSSTEPAFPLEIHGYMYYNQPIVFQNSPRRTDQRLRLETTSSI